MKNKEKTMLLSMSVGGGLRLPEPPPADHACVKNPAVRKSEGNLLEDEWKTPDVLSFLG